jgi:hypothetical protein
MAKYCHEGTKITKNSFVIFVPSWLQRLFVEAFSRQNAGLQCQNRLKASTPGQKLAKRHWNSRFGVIESDL